MSWSRYRPRRVAREHTFRNTRSQLLNECLIVHGVLLPWCQSGLQTAVLECPGSPGVLWAPGAGLQQPPVRFPSAAHLLRLCFICTSPPRVRSGGQGLSLGISVQLESGMAEQESWEWPRSLLTKSHTNPTGLCERPRGIQHQGSSSLQDGLCHPIGTFM